MTELTLEEVPLVVRRRLHHGRLVAHDGLEGRLERRAPVLVVDVEPAQGGDGVGSLAIELIPPQIIDYPNR